MNHNIYMAGLEKIALNRAMLELFKNNISASTRSRISKTMLGPEKRQQLMEGLKKGNDALIKKHDIKVYRGPDIAKIEETDYGLSAFAKARSRAGRSGAATYEKSIVIPDDNTKELKFKILGYNEKSLPLIKVENDPILLRHEIDEIRIKPGSRSPVFSQTRNHRSPQVIRGEAIAARAMPEADRLRMAKARKREAEVIGQIGSGSKRVKKYTGLKGKVLEASQGLISKLVTRGAHPNFAEAFKSEFDKQVNGYWVSKTDRRSVGNMKNWRYA